MREGRAALRRLLGALGTATPGLVAPGKATPGMVTSAMVPLSMETPGLAHQAPPVPSAPHCEQPRSSPSLALGWQDDQSGRNKAYLAAEDLGTL